MGGKNCPSSGKYPSHAKFEDMVTFLYVFCHFYEKKEGHNLIFRRADPKVIIPIFAIFDFFPFFCQISPKNEF
jgi:hypothetical protein